jgi:arylsulfatase
MDQWKIHFNTKEDYYANVVPLTAPLFFNIRMDPNESYDKEGGQHLLQKKSWLLAPMGEQINAHIKTLLDNPPVQGSNSFDMSNIMDVIKKGHE